MNGNRNALVCFFALAVLMAVGMFVVGLVTIPPSTDESIIALQAKHILVPHPDPEVRTSIHPKPLFWRFPLLFMGQPYLFPLEAYIAAIPQRFLSPGAFGVRAVPFALSLAALVFSFMIMGAFGKTKDTWPGLLLLVFPSAYVLMMQFGYALPGYPSHLLLTALAILLMQRYAVSPRWLTAAGCGVVCAAALAGQFMAAPLLLMCGVLTLLYARGLNKVWHTALLGGLSLTGWAPIWLAKKLYPGAHTAVSGTWPLADAMERLWAPAMNFVLPVACGIKTTVFPDNTRHIEPWPLLTSAWPFLWMALIAVAIGFLLLRVWKSRLQLQGDQKLTAAIFVGLSIAAILLFVLSRRSHSHTYRYLLNTAWAIPFIVAYVYSETPWRWMRKAIAGFAVGLALFNLLVISLVVKEWTTPNFAADEGSFYDTAPALAYLEKMEIDRVYAGYSLAYRLTYLSDEAIIAGQYYNERFFGWPLPYKSVVDQATNIAYVLAPRFAITADRFMDDMQAMGMNMTVFQAGELTVFHDFRLPDSVQGDWIVPAGLRAEASHRAGDAAFLIDGVYEHRWRSRHAQEPGMWVAVYWDEPVPLDKVYMYYNYYHHDRARALDVYVQQEGEWHLLREQVPHGMDAHEFDRGRPVYGNQFQRIALEPVAATGVRIQIAEEEAGRDWTIGEIRLWGNIPVESSGRQ